MANSLTGFNSANVQGRVLDVLRQNAIFPRLAMREPGTDPVNRGSTVDFPLSGSITARTISAAVTPATNQDITSSRVQLTVGNWYEASFYFTDQEAAHLRDGVIGPQTQEAIKSIGNVIDQDAWKALYAAQYANFGTPGTTPFATNLNVLGSAKATLTKQLAPQDNRYFVMDSSAEMNMVLLSNILQTEQFGSRSGIVDGAAGRVLGFDLFVNQNVSTLTAATTAWATGYSIATGGAAAAATTITVINATVGGAIQAGTMFKSGAGYYSVYATVTSTTNTNVALVIQPALATAASSGDAITLVAAYTPNIAFHRDALAFVSRPAMGAFMSDNSSTVVDPVTGVALTFKLTQEYYQQTLRVSALWGFKVVRPQFVYNIAG